MPPAYCDLIFRVSHSKDKSRESKCSFGFYGPSGETRTCGIMIPKTSWNFFLTISAPFWHHLFHKSCSLKLFPPLFPCAPNPVMVKYVVKNRFPQNPGSGSFILVCRGPSKWFDNCVREATACGIPSLR